MRILLGSIAFILLAAAGCHFHAEEPKQRPEWSASPMKYGDTQWAGLRSPDADGGTD
jgi:hypothetical protein